jgi:hypothetical protein
MVMMAVWQGLGSDSISGVNTRLLMIFVGIVAISMLSQAIIFLFMALGAKRTNDRVLMIAEELRAKAAPVIDSAQNLISETVPKLKTMTDNFLETSEIARAKAQEFDITLTEANRRARGQMARVDGMVTTGLTATGALAEMVHQGIRRPVIEIVGLANAVKAGIDVLMSKTKGFGRRS